jgi:hypothetical protein
VRRSKHRSLSIPLGHHVRVNVIYHVHRYGNHAHVTVRVKHIGGTSASKNLALQRGISMHHAGYIFFSPPNSGFGATILLAKFRAFQPTQPDATPMPSKAHSEASAPRPWPLAFPSGPLREQHLAGNPQRDRLRLQASR